MTELTVPPETSKWTPPPNTLWLVTDEQRRARPAAQYGHTAATVAANVKRLRERRGLTIYEMSARLRKADRPITPAAVGKIERQQRQVTVDDLVALSVVLGVPPSALLLPLDDRPSTTFEVTGAGEVRGDVAWDWADGRRPLKPIPAKSEHDTEETVALEFLLYARPPVRRKAESQRELTLTEAPPRGARTPEELAADRRAYERLSEVRAVTLEAFRRQDPEAFEERD